jgi:AraC family transcriptional regulator
MEIRLPPGKFYGDIRSTFAIPHFRLLEAYYPPDTRLPKHLHEVGCFSLMTYGSLTENYQGRSLEWTAQGVGFNPPDEEHSNVVHSKGARFFIIELSQKWNSDARDRQIEFGSAAVYKAGTLNWLANRLYHEARFADDVSPLAIEGLALEMMAEISRQSRFDKASTPPWLTQAREIIHDRFAETLTTSAIAEAVGVHPVRLARAFRNSYHSTIGDHVRRIRVEFACSELSGSAHPLSEIAANAGFCDQAHLTRVFKKFTGVTPAQYRSATRR